jgi:phenylalanyl-tRNA synthetase alpha subunit
VKTGHSREAVWRSDLVERGNGRDFSQLLGLVVDGDGYLAQLLFVLPSVVGAEEELRFSGQLDPDVGLGAATIATIGCGQTR